MQQLIERLDPQKTNRVEIHDIEPFTQFYKGRVVILGDAAHSTTPDIGQGGCQAMEDAIYLARSLQINTLGLEDALRRYQNKRNERANELVLRARKRCDVTHMKDETVTQAGMRNYAVNKADILCRELLAILWVIHSIKNKNSKDFPCCFIF